MKYACLLFVFYTFHINNFVSKKTNPKNEHNYVSAYAHTDTLKENTQPKINPTQINSIVWANIILSQQRMYLYENGFLVNIYKVSTGNKTHKTPCMNRRPSGPMYLKYTSKKFPGGNYMGLGNMPYVVFIKGGYAIHGTTPGNFSLLGRTASHGCIRLHPVNAKIFYDLVQKHSLKNTWVTIQN